MQYITTDKMIDVDEIIISALDDPVRLQIKCILPNILHRNLHFQFSSPQEMRVDLSSKVRYMAFY